MPAAASSTQAAGKAKPLSAAQEAKQLQAFLTTHAAELEQLPNGKIRCLLTHTDLPARLAPLQQYWTGPALARAKEAVSDAELAERYPRLQAHKSNKNKLFCTLTRLTLNRRRSHVEAHVRGKKYQKAQEAEEQKRRAREERERKRREKKESGKDDDVEARLPEGVLEDDVEDEAEADEGRADEDDEDVEDDGEGGEAERERVEDDEEDMPIVRKVAVPASRKRKSAREEEEEEVKDDEADEQEDDDEEADDSDEEEHAGSGEAGEDGEDAEDADSGEEEKQKQPTMRGRAMTASKPASKSRQNGQQHPPKHTNGSATNGQANKRQAVSAAASKQHANGNKRVGKAASGKR